MPNQHMVPADCLYILQVVVPYTVLRIREGMGPVAQPYDLYITVCLRLHDGPVAVTGWDVRKTEWKPWLAGVAASCWTSPEHCSCRELVLRSGRKHIVHVV